MQVRFLDFLENWKLEIENCAAMQSRRGMTLIETLVAISILAVAIVAPMSLTVQSLSAAYYAKDQIAASNLAQEAIESVRSVRDGNILKIALNTTSTCDADGLSMHLMCGIPVDTDFKIDTRNNSIVRCDADGTDACDPLETDGDLYGYGLGEDTKFTRSVQATFIDDFQQEIRVMVTVTWQSGSQQTMRTFTIYENLYRWVSDGSGE